MPLFCQFVTCSVCNPTVFEHGSELRRRRLNTEARKISATHKPIARLTKLCYCLLPTIAICVKAFYNSQQNIFYFQKL